MEWKDTSYKREVPLFVEIILKEKSMFFWPWPKQLGDFPTVVFIFVNFMFLMKIQIQNHENNKR